MWKNSVIYSEFTPVNSINFHPGNYKMHPNRQGQAVTQAIVKLGWVGRVVINLRLAPEWGELQGKQVLLDGHLRVNEARKAGEEFVPADFVDYLPEEENLFLATYDPLGRLGIIDDAKLKALATQDTQNAELLKAALRGAGVETRMDFTGLSLVPEGQEESGKTPTQEKAEKQNTQDEKYPLAIVLSKQYYGIWQSYKARLGIRLDTQAFTKLLDEALAEMEGE